MQGRFVGIYESQVIYNGIQQNLSLPLEKCRFLISDFEIRCTNIIPQDANFTIVQKEEMLYLNFSVTKTLFIVFIYDVMRGKKDPNSFSIVSKQITSQGEIWKKIKMKSLFFPCGEKFGLECFDKCLGEVLIGVQRRFYFSMSKAELMSTPKPFLESATSKSEGVIIGMNDYHIGAEETKTKCIYYMNPAQFCKINKIDIQISQGMLIQKPVKILVFSKYIVFKLTSLVKKLELCTHPSVELQNSIFPDYLKSAPKNQFERIPFERTVLKQSQQCKDYFISMPSMNQSLGCVLGLAISEHLFRFSTDKVFKELIKNLLKNSSIGEFMEIENSLYRPDKNFRFFNENICGNFLNCIKSFGNSIQEMLDSDITSVNGWQKVSDLLGVCLKMKDFTNDCFVNLIPHEFKLNPRPIFRIGRYHTHFFLMYTRRIMIEDGFDMSNKTKVFAKNEIHPKIEYPFYDFQPKSANNSFLQILDSFTQKIELFANSVISKAKGESINQNLEFNDLANMIRELAVETSDTQMRNLSEKIQRIDLLPSLFVVSQNKFQCLQCKMLYTEIDKVRYNCGCMYCIQDNNFYIGQPCHCRKNYLVKK